MTEIPIACTLSAADYEQRMRDIAALGHDALLDAGTDGGRATLRFSDHPGVRERLQAIVAAEGACCSFLDLSLSDADGALVLAIAAPPDGAFMVRELSDAFRAASLRRG
jgi:hypothetical protein